LRLAHSNRPDLRVRKQSIKESTTTTIRRRSMHLKARHHRWALVMGGFAVAVVIASPRLGLGHVQFMPMWSLPATSDKQSIDLFSHARSNIKTSYKSFLIRPWRIHLWSHGILAKIGRLSMSFVFCKCQAFDSGSSCCRTKRFGATRIHERFD
jgi:hypothetical protein